MSTGRCCVATAPFILTITPPSRGCAASGVAVTIATGRLYSGTHHVARMVGIEGPIACVDGSHIVDSNDDERALPRHHRSASDAALLRERAGAPRRGQLPLRQRHHRPRPRGRARSPATCAPGRRASTWSPDVLEHPYWEHERGLMAVVAVGAEADIRAAMAELEERLANAAP